MTRTQRRWLGWGVAAAILALATFQISRNPQWRHFDWSRLESLLLHLNVWALILAILAGYASYLVRAWRWQFFTNPVKRCSLGILFAGQILGFSTVYLIGRAGEVVRPAYIAKKERLPFTSQAAVWVLERICDSLALVVLLAITLYFAPPPEISSAAGGVARGARRAAGAVTAFCVLVIVLLILYRIYSDRFLAWLQRGPLRAVPPRLRPHIEGFFHSFTSGLSVMQDPADALASILCTAVLWGLNVTVMWLDFRSLGGGIASLSWRAASLTLVLSSLGLLVQLPGIGGGYQVVILLVLKDVFRVSAEAAASAAILIWLTVMAPCVALGIILAIREGLTLKKLKAMAGVGGST